MFKRAKQNRVFQDVVDQIQDAILEGKLAPGQKLPAERDLKDMFNTSRGTLREALRVLEQKGLIEIKLGVAGGAIVKQIDTEPIIESLALLIRSGGIALEHLAEFRIKIEGSIVELAALRATPEDIREMELLYKKAKAYCDKGDWENFLKTDETMHSYLGTMSRNPIFQFIQKSIHDNIHQYYESYLPMNHERTLENLNDFERIIAAIKMKDAATAADIIRDHVERFNKKMQEKTHRP
ncbi:MAG: FadR family transcriptional regulator [Proteobacteria bacterium]|nr:FadR family transcriptional regulator [Desulfobacula sp.]MBU3953634.1 FadR family transcriptional regulator [Pseudomonadota bacterium]MBU4130129.1 FadR family transcriptional regulator [Pseudomonadota bacterium]